METWDRRNKPHWQLGHGQIRRYTRYGYTVHNSEQDNW